MDDTTPIPDAGTARPRRRPATGLKIALVAAGITAGAIGATAFGASAATTGSSGTTSGSGSSSVSAPGGSTGSGPRGTMPARPANPHTAAPVRSDEKEVTGSTAATLKAAALKAVPGGTVYRIETDAGDGTYEAHMTKSDGSEVTVKFGKDLAVTKVEQGMGQGDPAPAGAPSH